jgi:hypothetical protein
VKCEISSFDCDVSYLLVHGESDTVVGGAVDNVLGEVLNVITAPQHGDKLKRSHEGSIRGPRGPVVEVAGATGDGIGDKVGRKVISPGETHFAAGASRTGVAVRRGRVRSRSSSRGGRVIVDASSVIITAVRSRAIVVAIVVIVIRRRVGSIGSVTERLLGNAAFPKLVGVTLVLEHSVVIGSHGMASMNTMAMRGRKRIYWGRTLREQGESDGGRNKNGVEDGHFFVTIE